MQRKELLLNQSKLFSIFFRKNVGTSVEFSSNPNIYWHSYSENIFNLFFEDGGVKLAGRFRAYLIVIIS
jgi:hypothetical protein